MASLPKWVDRALTNKRVVVERYGRGTTGRPTALRRKWFFCGWYYHREDRGRVVDGPFGPFPCWSAASADAASRYNITH